LFKTTGMLVKTGLIVSLGVAALAGTMTPTYAGDGGAIAAGVIGGTALGLLAGSAAAGAYGPGPGYPPPPPAYGYAPPAPAYYEPPRHRCHWDGYAGVYVDRYGRVCE
jgi:hypothetical protein